MRKAMTAAFWCSIVSLAEAALGLMFVFFYATSPFFGSGECTQYEQVQSLEAFRSDLIVIVALASAGSALLYWLLTEEQVFFGRNSVRMLWAIGFSVLWGRPLFLLLLNRGSTCLQTALSEPTNLPAYRVALFGHVFSNNVFLATWIDQLALALVFVTGAYLLRKTYAAVAAGRLWPSS